MTPFAAMIQACALSQAQAAELLGQSQSYVDKKARGVRPASAADVNLIGRLWHVIRTGDEEGVIAFPRLSDPSGPLAMLEAVRLMRGVAGLERASVPKKQRKADAALAEIYEKEKKR